MKTGIPTNGSMVKKPHIIKRRDSGTMQYGELSSYCGTRFVKFIFWIVIDLKEQESHSSSSSASSSSPLVSEIQIREQEDGINSVISPVQVSNSVDDRSGQPDETTIDRDNLW